MGQPAPTPRHAPRPSSDGLRDAFLERARHAIERMSSEMSEGLLLRALSAPSDLGAIARALGDGELADPALRIDPLAPAAARALEARAALLQAAGPMMTSAEVGALLGITRPAVDKRRASRRLLGLRIGSDWRYPAFQFRDGAILPGLPQVLALMDRHDPWSVLDELLARDDAWGGRSLLHVLTEDDAEALGRWAAQAEGDGYA